jgi:L-lactate dehydrogenase complex protein LldG
VSAREEILRRIGTAPGDPVAEYAAIERRYLRRHHEADGPDGQSIVDLFADRVADYRAIVHRVTAAEVPATIAAALAARPDSGRYAVPAGLPAEWTADVDPARLVPDPDDGLDDLAGVLTGCAVAIAETGSIVLDHGAAQGRRALTLVPDYHLVVVTADRIAADIPDALERLDLTRPVTFISGPSATSDIELARVEGVHGPRTLEVVIA